METSTLIMGVYVFILAAFVGYMVITKVPALLHTPLMSATNAISGISLVGSLVAAGANYSAYSTWLRFCAVPAPDKARRGMQLAAVGMLAAVVGTLVDHRIIDYTWIIVGLVLGSGVGAA